jgi:hypothetical protein
MNSDNRSFVGAVECGTGSEATSARPDLRNAALAVSACVQESELTAVAELGYD